MMSNLSTMMSVGSNTIVSGDRAVAYLRTAQSDDGAIAGQREMVKRYAGRYGISDVHCYTDNGASGISAERPALMELLNDVQTGKVDVVIIHSFGRIARSYILINEILAVLKAHGVRLVSVTGG